MTRSESLIAERVIERLSPPRIVDGYYFHNSTPVSVCDVIVRFRSYRLKIWYGDTETGRAWGDVSTGSIGRSTGERKIPLLIANRRSSGGEAILDDAIVRIDYANKKHGGTIYKHPAFHEVDV